jgi:SAM-dependent methyltransferase
MERATMTLIPALDTLRSRRLKPEQRSVSDSCLEEEIQRRRWYHRMDLGNGVVTPGFPWEWIWNNARRVRERVEYADKSVLDLGSWDGLWAFEAEALGAALVVATDCMNSWQTPPHQGMENLLLVREALYSRVIPLWNVSPVRLRERLDNLLYSHPKLEHGFDIVQHLGLLYHLRDPMLSLAQARSVMREGGILLLETAVHRSQDTAAMYFNFGPDPFYDDYTTWWVPTLSCLREMLRASLFEVDPDSVTAPFDENPTVCRTAMIATAVAPRDNAAHRYNLDPAYGHGFGGQLIATLPFDSSAASRRAAEDADAAKERKTPAWRDAYDPNRR